MPIANTADAAILIAKPGAMRDAWRALLMVLPRIRDIEQVEDVAAALQAVARLHPALIVVDVTLLKGDTQTLLGQVKTLSPETRWVAFNETIEQKQAQAIQSVEMVMLQGTPAAEVAATLERLLMEAAH